MNMRKQAVLGAVLVVMFLGGCSTGTHLNSTIESNKPLMHRPPIHFKKQELLTRNWLGVDGAPMSLISFEVLSVSNRNPLAIARYGEKTNRRVYCLDFYEHYESREPDDPVLELLCHDVRSGWVRNLGVEYQKGEVYLTIAREFETGVSNTYSYRYTQQRGLTSVPGDFWPVPVNEAIRK